MHTLSDTVLLLVFSGILYTFRGAAEPNVVLFKNGLKTPATLPCRASIITATIFEAVWYFESRPIWSRNTCTGKYCVAKNDIQNGIYNVAIYNVTGTDAGLYLCVLVYDNKQEEASTTKLIVTDVPGRPIIEPVQPIGEGLTVTFTCISSGSYPVPSIYWYYKNAHQRALTHTWNSTAVSTLTLTLSHADDKTLLTCKANNSVGDSASDIALNVHYKVRNVVILPIPNMAAVIEGGSMTLTCVSTGNPTPVLSWTRTDGLPLASVHMSASVVTFSSVRRQDAGIYTCTGTNAPLGLQTSMSANVTVDVLYPPSTPSITLRFDELNAGEDAILTCHSTDPGNPPGTYSWTKDSVTIASTGHSTTLKLSPVQVSSGGSYACNVFNPIANTESTKVNLTVYERLTSNSGNGEQLTLSPTNIVLVSVFGFFLSAALVIAVIYKLKRSEQSSRSGDPSASSSHSSRAAITHTPAMFSGQYIYPRHDHLNKSRGNIPVHLVQLPPRDYLNDTNSYNSISSRGTNFTYDQVHQLRQ